MHNSTFVKAVSASVFGLLLGAGTCSAETPGNPRIETTVRDAVTTVMQKHQIPGMTVAVIANGKANYFSFGVASKETGVAVSEHTLFEIGSLSKTFTTTLAAYAQANGKLSLSDKASQILPDLRGSAFDAISLLQLCTYSGGGLPLQFPKEADSADKMLGYFKQWTPRFTAGSQRVYSNPSLGLCGYLAAHSLGQPFDAVMEKTLLPALGLKHTYLKVPQDQMSLYAQGYNKDGNPVRVGPGALDSEAYGLKTSAAELVRYVEANMKPSGLSTSLQQAIATTHTGYYMAGPMTQGLGWESYAYPVSLDTLLAGNASEMAMQAQPAQWLTAPQTQTQGMLFNKTGSTSGFGAYAAYVPSKDIGVVILANRNYPIPERVRIAHAVLSAFAE